LSKLRPRHRADSQAPVPLLPDRGELYDDYAIPQLTQTLRSLLDDNHTILSLSHASEARSSGRLEGGYHVPESRQSDAIVPGSGADVNDRTTLLQPEQSDQFPNDARRLPGDGNSLVL
jgi:hypothetical protein